VNLLDEVGRDVFCSAPGAGRRVVDAYPELVDADDHLAPERGDIAIRIDTRGAREQVARPVVFALFLGNSCRGRPMKGGALEGF